MECQFREDDDLMVQLLLMSRLCVFVRLLFIVLWQTLFECWCWASPFLLDLSTHNCLCLYLKAPQVFTTRKNFICYSVVKITILLLLSTCQQVMTIFEQVLLAIRIRNAIIRMPWVGFLQPLGNSNTIKFHHLVIKCKKATAAKNRSRSDTRSHAIS